MRFVKSGAVLLKLEVALSQHLWGQVGPVVADSLLPDGALVLGVGHGVIRRCGFALC